MDQVLISHAEKVLASESAPNSAAISGSRGWETWEGSIRTCLLVVFFPFNGRVK